MSKVIAICIGSLSSINTEKLQLKFEGYSTSYTLRIYRAPSNRSGPMELAAYLVLQERNAAVWITIQGMLFQDGKEQRSAEEVQMLVDGTSKTYVDWLFWNDRTNPGEMPSIHTEPEELFARKLFEMLTREMVTSH